MPQHLTVPLTEAPEARFANSRPRRCPNEDCNGVAILVDAPVDELDIEEIVRTHGRRHYACASCGLPALRPSDLHCPCCSAWMRRDGRGEPACPVCPPLPPAPTDPRSAWEGAFAFDGRTRPEEWGCNGSADWDRFGTPAHVPSRLALRFGYEDHRQKFIPGTDDEQLAADDAWRTERIAVLAAAIKLITAHGKSRPLPPKTRTLPGWYKALAARAWPAYRQFLFDTAAELVNAITMRGGSYADITETVHVRRERSTPFAGYRHALRAALGAIDPEQEAPGRGSGSLGRAASVEYKHGLPGGIVFNVMSVAPSHSGASIASTSRGTREDDARSCLAAARVGGIWTPVELLDDGTPAPGKVARVEGGRPLTRVERKLLELVELGAVTGEDYARLPVRQALRRIQSERGEQAYPEARHIQEGEARTMVRKARVASLEAFEAWGLIEKQASETVMRTAADPVTVIVSPAEAMQFPRYS